MLAPGDTVDRYTVLEAIGAGGQASVWKARDRRTGETVALKLVSMLGDATANHRARREAAMLSTVTHPSLVRCHRLFEDARRRVLGLVLEWVEGTTLDAARRDPRWTQAHTVAVLTHVAHALATLHEHRVVHRDLKPSNVLISNELWFDPLALGAVKLADLGIAAGVGNPRAMTSMGFVVGTAAFMAPEVLGADGREADALPTRDVFAFGVMGWLLDRGVHPTGLGADAGAADLSAIYEDHAEAPSLWLAEDADDDALVRLLKRCLRLRPEERPADGRALVGLLPALPGRATARGAAKVPARTRLGARVAETPMTTIVGASVAIAVSVVAVLAATASKASKAVEREVTQRVAPSPDAPHAVTPANANGAPFARARCWPNTDPLPSASALAGALRSQALDTSQFDQKPCEAVVTESSSHCAMTHVAGRWLRLRFSLPAKTRLSAEWTDRSSRLAPVVKPWSKVGAGATATGGVDVYVAIPSEPADLRITSSSWGAPHTLQLRPGDPTVAAFAEKGPCR